MTAQTLTHRLAAAWDRLTPQQRTAFVVAMERAREPLPCAWEGEAPTDVPRPPVVVVRGGYRPRATATNEQRGELT